jgi:hypothetical protein
MNTIIVQHDVQDFATWKSVFESDQSGRAAASITSHTVGQLAGSPNTAVIVMQVEDLGKLQAMLQSPDLQATMQAAGVISAPTVTVVTGTESKVY